MFIVTQRASEILGMHVDRLQMYTCNVYGIQTLHLRKVNLATDRNSADC